jgi:hypothetical protein
MSNRFPIVGAIVVACLSINPSELADSGGLDFPTVKRPLPQYIAADNSC